MRKVKNNKNKFKNRISPNNTTIKDRLIKIEQPARQGNFDQSIYSATSRYSSDRNK